MKILIAVLCRLKIRVIVEMDDMLWISQAIDSILMAGDTLMFLLQHLGVVINIQKCILQSVQETEFLVLQVNS